SCRVLLLAMAKGGRDQGAKIGDTFNEDTAQHPDALNEEEHAFDPPMDEIGGDMETGDLNDAMSDGSFAESDEAFEPYPGALGDLAEMDLFDGEIRSNGYASASNTCTSCDAGPCDGTNKVCNACSGGGTMAGDQSGNGEARTDPRKSLQIGGRSGGGGRSSSGLNITSPEELAKLRRSPGKGDREQQKDSPFFSAQVGQGAKDTRVKARRGAPDRKQYELRDRLTVNNSGKAGLASTRSRSARPTVRGDISGPTRPSTDRIRLTPTQIETVISKHRATLDGMNPGDRRMAEDYFRRLKDTSGVVE
ncbi:MAG: hypothetical protein AAF492_09705, partial [Verrucomicrobiota bacterium]